MLKKKNDVIVKEEAKDKKILSRLSIQLLLKNEVQRKKIITLKNEKMIKVSNLKEENYSLENDRRHI